MLKYLVRGCTLLLLLGALGCGGSEREGLISQTVEQLNRGTAVLGNITDAVEKGIKAAEAEKRPLAATDFDKVIKEIIPELKEVGSQMQALKRKIETNRDSVTEDQRKDLHEKFSKQTQQAFVSLQEGQEALRKAVQKAQNTNEEAVKDLKQKLAEAQGEFEIIAKLR